LIYAYDVDSEEPIASSIYPGNMLDYTAFKDFLKTYDMKKGLLILDKGFNDKECKELMQQKNINYLIPIKLDFAVKKLNLKTGF
ncbi:transposase, partial [Mycoplasma mycoides]